MAVNQLPNMVEYQEKREEVVALFRRLGRGSQQQASYATEISATIVSLVLGGRYIDEPKLTALGRWATERLAKQETTAPASV